MTLRENALFLVVISLLLLIAACGKKSTVESNPDVTIYILVTNENGDPIPDAVITTDPATITTSTDSAGKAVIENIISRSYSVIVTKAGFPSFNKSVKFEGVSETNLHFIIFSTIEITLTDDVGRLVTDTKIQINPGAQILTTDSNGKAVLVNVPEGTYQFSIMRLNLPPVNINAVIDQNNTGTLHLVITSEKPVATILKPEDNSVWRRFDITFEGNGTDYEDGELSGNSLVWYSGINGMLGTGNTLTTDRLSIGKHMITLTITDSDKKTDRKNITVVVIDYNPDSYFPISEKTSWEYRYLYPTFSFVNSNNVTELWTIKNLSVLIDNMKRRTSTVYYDITIASVTNHVKYTIIDNLEEVDNDIYVVSTSEKMIEWKEVVENENNPHLTLDITTEYSPDYLIIKDITNPIKALPLEFIVKTTTEWSSKFYNIVQEYHDTEKDLVTKIEAGSSRYIQTDTGVFKATELVITTPDSHRIWWLTKSVGIIALESTIRGVDNTAILVDSGLTDYYRDDTSTQARPVAATGKPYPVKMLHINRENGEGLMELRNFLRTMAP